MRKEMRKREARGSTLVELMVAVVILAIVVMFIALVPTQSQNMMLKADRTATASAAGRDKMEYFRHVIGRTSSTYSGFAVLKTLYPNPTMWYTDTFKLSEIRVLREWQLKFPSGLNGDSAKASIELHCVPLTQGAITADSVWIVTWVAKRDTLPPMQ